MKVENNFDVIFVLSSVCQLLSHHRWTCLYLISGLGASKNRFLGQSVCTWKKLKILKLPKLCKQAGAELGQAQPGLGLEVRIWGWGLKITNMFNKEALF